MANNLSVLNPEIWKPVVQDYLNNMLISNKISNTKCEAHLKSGDQVNFPYVSDVRVQSYAQGTDLTMDELEATQSSLTVDQSKAATFILDPVQERQAEARYGLELAYQAAYQLKNNIDQTLINTAVTGANSTITGGSLTTSTILEVMNQSYAELFRQNATDSNLFAVVDAEHRTLLTQTFVANGFNEADSMLKNQFIGRAAGFDVYVTNNLKYTVVLTNDTQPTAGDTITIAGVTWTCVADGTAANAGEINIGTDLADWKTIIVKALNGTSSADYVDVSVENRRKLQNSQLTAATFSGNTCTITNYGKMKPSETFTAATNVFGTETTNLLFGRYGAPSLAIQMYPELYIREEPKQLAKNYITHTLYGTKVFTRDAKRLVKVSVNVA